MTDPTPATLLGPWRICVGRRYRRIDMSFFSRCFSGWRVPVLAVAFLATGLVRAADGSATGPAAAAPPDARPGPGVEAARTLSQVTGIAISPLLGTAGLGAWQYAHAKAEVRPTLPWYAQPWFWGPALALVGLCALKDSSGVALPTALKKPFDIAELFENKLSALIATGAIVPLAIKTFGALNPPPSAGLDAAAGHLAMMDLSWLGNALAAPTCLLIFGAVWLVNHTVQVLIAISPFATVDAVLKAGRTALLASVVGTHFIDPRLGAIWAGIIAVVCLFLSGWAFRLSVLGTIFGLDVLTFRSRRYRPEEQPLEAFAAAQLGKAPRRTLGRLSLAPDGRLEFVWRPWLVFAPRSEFLSPTECWLGDGLLHNDIRRDEAAGGRPIFLLPPRCNGHETAIAGRYRLAGVRPAGLRAIRAWLHSTLTGATA